MSALNSIIVVGVVVIFVVAAIWFTRSTFKNIESGETDRRKHIEEDVKVSDKKKGS